MLAYARALGALQVGASVAIAVAVLHDELVAALAAPGDALEQGGAVAGSAARLAAEILRVVVAQHRLDPLKGLPIDVGRITVLDHDPPLVPQQARHDRPSVGGPRVARAAIGEGFGVCGVAQHPADRTRGGRRPGDIAARFTPRQVQPTGAQAAHHLGRRALLEEAAEHQFHTALHGTVRILGHRALGTARKSRRQCQRQVAALGLAQQAGGQAAAQRVQLDLGDGPLQAKQQAPVGRTRIVDALAVADEALPVAA